MRLALPALLLLLCLPACGKEAPKAAPEEESGAPQIATSLDDLAAPIDRSDQITAIDAATGDANGMPKDGGAVVRAPKPQPRPATAPAAEVAVPVPAAPSPPPVLTMPPPPAASSNPATGG